MTRIEAEEEAWLKQARRALAPSAGDFFGPAVGNDAWLVLRAPAPAQR